MTPVPAIAPLQPNTPPAPGQDPPTSSPKAPLLLPVSPSQPPTPYDFIQTNQLSELDPYYGNPYDPRNCDVPDLGVYLRETGQFDEFNDDAEENWYTSDEGERTPNARVEVQVAEEGAYEIIGTDNNDDEDYSIIMTPTSSDNGDGDVDQDDDDGETSATIYGTDSRSQGIL
jgi:hypothetical protein